MKEILCDFELGALSEAALAHLKLSCNFDPGREMHRRMLDEAMSMRGNWSRGAAVRTAAVFADRFSLRGNVLEISGVRLECAVFARLGAECLAGVFVYALSLRRSASAAGDMFAAGSVSAAFYDDLWGNAYVEAGMDALKDRLSRECGEGLRLSDSFGPGYYGMETSEMKKLALLLDFSRIGAKVEESSMISPLKSCAGIFLISNGEAPMPEPSCRQCAGDRRGCDFCSRNRMGQD